VVKNVAGYDLAKVFIGEPRESRVIVEARSNCDRCRKRSGSFRCVVIR